jgi:SNF2 family DNA or RNA helicase
VLHELPEKIEDVRRCPLSDEQRALYREALDTRGAALRAQLLRTDQPVPYLHVFALLNQLKRICDHPALALNRPAEYLAASSGKWELFVEILGEALEGGHKVVVFSQYLGMLEIMERHLRAAGTGFVKLTGATADRGRIVDRFNADPDCRVFLGSLKAGGAGIDLVGGSVVVHYDRWWNAAREDQATDRVHRIGQRRAVQVFKLIAEGTLEERIDAIIAGKRELLDASVAVDDPHLAKVFSREELIALLGGPDPASPVDALS